MNTISLVTIFRSGRPCVGKQTKTRRLWTYGCAMLLFAGPGCGGSTTSPTQTPTAAPTAPTASVFQPLEFPFAEPTAITRMAAWGIPNWSGAEPHNGIDFQINGQLTSTLIVSPAGGEVIAVSSSENPFSNPPGQLMVRVDIRATEEWVVYIVLEPSTVDPTTKATQLAAVRVRPGQRVSVGTPVADLLVGTLGYPHLHFMIQRNNQDVCAYAQSSEAAKRTIESIARYSTSNVPGGQICVGQS